MKTKTPKLKPRRMWANATAYADSKPAANTFSRRKFAYDDVPVAVIPLDDVEGLVDRAYDAFLSEDAHFESNDVHCIRAALIAIGLPPKQRKGKGRA